MSRYSTGNQTTGKEHSADQLSAVWNDNGGVVGAWPASRDGGHTWEIEVKRFESNFNLTQQINLQRGGQAASRPLSQDTSFLTTITEFSERTRILALDGDRLALDDQDLVKWLVTAEQQVILGTDNHPLFETSLDDTACVIRRLPNGLVAITEVPRAHVLAARERVRTLIGDRVVSYVDTCIETPVRSTARYFLTAVKEGEQVQRAGKEAEVTAFILIARTGFRFGLWSPAAGLFSEYGFLAPKEVAQSVGKSPVSGFQTLPMAAATDEKGLETYVRQAFDQLELQLSKEKLEQLQLSGYAQVVWASEPQLAKVIAPIAAEHASQTGIGIFHLDAALDEAVVGGLLLGSFAFGDTSAFGASVLPQADLARDLLVLANTEQDQIRYSEEMFAQRRLNRAVFNLLAAPIVAIAVLLAITAGLILSQLVTSYRDAQADARTKELKPALDVRNSIEANLKWYQEFVKQVSRLRKQQPVGIGLLYQLNSDYPFNVDQSFFISDMKLLPTGAVEMKGYARNKDAVASFLKSLEFAGGPESGSRMFGNLAYEVQEGAPQPVAATGQAALPTMAGSLIAANQIRPGVIVWSIKGTYLPMEEFAPPPPPKPGATPAPAATPAPKPAGQ
ncbi:MAG TPA: hypothetical protein VLI65_11705 [Pyrinomonadaceae bacterium]|nr:hypothetical protein [Pyrinomonadaceae bacterium]